jgi:hypothetical protein
MSEHQQPGISEDELESLTTDDMRWKNVAQQFAAINLRMSGQDLAIEENTKLTKQVAASTLQVAESTAEMVKIFNAVQGGVKILSFIGGVARWVGYILAPVGVWWAIKHGQMPGG